MRNYFMLAALGLFVATGTAWAADDWNRSNVGDGQWLSPNEIADKLSAQGYKVTEIEADDGAYEVEMVNKDGVRIETHVNPVTGELLPGYDD
jgi:hypothetical protein